MVPAVQFERVSKRFRLGEAHGSLREWLAAGAARLAGRTANRDATHFWALREVNFSIEAGEAVGIVGPNGAGKSTALKLLSRILRPDDGSITVNGRLAGLIEVGAGFHGDLTGRENIFLNGSILGMSRREIQGKFDGIVAFAGLENFLEMPVKRYSSGMYARLGFAIASHVDADLLLVDEVLSVGDAVFRLRCMERMRQLVARGTTLVFVTHDLEQMQSICTRAIVLDRGQVAYSGAPSDAVGQYLMAVSQAHAARAADIDAVIHEGTTARTMATSAEESGPGRDCSLALLSQEMSTCGRVTSLVHGRERLTIELLVECRTSVERLVAECNLRSASGQALLSINSGRDGSYFPCRSGRQRIGLEIDGLPLAAGQYFWNVRLWDADTGRCHVDTPFCYPMVIQDDGRACGLVHVSRRWLQGTEESATGNCSTARTVPAHHVAGALGPNGREAQDHDAFLEHHVGTVPA